VSHRFHLKPLIRAIARPLHAFVLALSEKDARLVKVFADRPATAVSVLDLPHGATGRGSRNNPGMGAGRGNAQSQKLLLLKYLRRVDAAQRPVFAGCVTPRIIDLRTVARAATVGAVDLLLVDADEVTPGTAHATDGTVVLTKRTGAASSRAIDEMTGRAILAVGNVLAV
jgi:hypothetical protein